MRVIKHINEWDICSESLFSITSTVTLTVKELLYCVSLFSFTTSFLIFPVWSDESLTTGFPFIVLSNFSYSSVVKILPLASSSNFFCRFSSSCFGSCNFERHFSSVSCSDWSRSGNLVIFLWYKLYHSISGYF